MIRTEKEIILKDWINLDNCIVSGNVRFFLLIS